MKKCLSIVIAAAIMVSICIPFTASAAEVPLPTAVTTNEPGISPYAFSRNYETYFTLNSEVQVMHDVNVDFLKDEYVSVTLVDCSGPTKFRVKICYREDDSLTWIPGIEKEITLNEGVNYNIPVGNSFCVKATAIDGQGGYATFQVALS